MNTFLTLRSEFLEFTSPRKISLRSHRNLDIFVAIQRSVMSLSNPITVFHADKSVPTSRESNGVTFWRFFWRNLFAELQLTRPETHPNLINFVAIQGSMMSLGNPITILHADEPFSTSRATFGVTSL